MINLSSSLGEIMEWQNTRILAQKVRVFPYFQASKPIEYLELSSSLGEMVGFCSLNNTLVYRRKQRKKQWDKVFPKLEVRKNEELIIFNWYYFQLLCCSYYNSLVQFFIIEGSSVMIGTTEWVECKEKAMGIVADWLWVLAIIIGEITGVIQGETIGLLYQCIRIVERIDSMLHSSLWEIVGYLRN